MTDSPWASPRSALPLAPRRRRLPGVPRGSAALAHGGGGGLRAARGLGRALPRPARRSRFAQRTNDVVTIARRRRRRGGLGAPVRVRHVINGTYTMPAGSGVYSPKRSEKFDAVLHVLIHNISAWRREI